MKDFQGLTRQEAEDSARRYGKNDLTAKKRKTFWQTYWSKFDDPIILILLVALGINIIFTFFGRVDWHECAGIFLSVLIATFVSSLSEFSNENTFQKLQEEAARILCKVYRDGRLQEIPISEIVTGDMVLLQTGDMIPADGRVISGHIMADQSPLNGESKEIAKIAPEGRKPEKSKLVDFWNSYSVYRGSVVCSGECVMETDAVGDATVYGRLTHEAQEETRESPLAIKLGRLAKSISRFGYISAIFLMLISFFQNAVLDQGFQMQNILAYFADTGQVASDLISSLIMGIIVIVVAVPEGLPLMIAIVCSLNMKKMLLSKVLVRKLIGIETAGSINILFSDKTGTITRGELETIRFLDGAGNTYEKFSAVPAVLKQMLGVSVLANSAARFSGNNIIGGNGTEKALLAFIGPRAVHMDGIDVMMDIPFSSVNKFSAAQISGWDYPVLVKGAPEKILPRCKKCFDGAGNQVSFSSAYRLEREMDALAAGAVRLLAIAVSESPLQGDALPEELILIGVAAIRDEIRPEARRAIEEVGRAGIQTVMITGDRKETAAAIAKDAGLLEDEGAIILTSQELNELTDEEIKKILPNIRVIARALPTDKSRLVRIAQEMGMVAGMTGDGVNDAPALKRADVGFAMGSGSDVAKEAGDIVILDNNFFSIRNAVLYGRTIYKSIKKFIQFQLTINVAAVTISILGPIVGVEKPLDISQMIWTNLMIDSLAAIAFGGEPALRSYLLEKPKRRDEDILDREMWSSVIWNGLYICALSLVIFISPWIHGFFRPAPNDIYFYTGYFTFFIFICIFNAFNARTESIDLMEKLSLNKQFITVMGGIGLTQIFMTYYGGAILRTAGLTITEWILVIALALTIIPVDLLRKILIKRRFSEKDV
ncbi:calcium-translocating P-type ATPase, PMCA-type [Ructibacterium gallinarum]|uniref:P-type Ca(2+) transporter n=1 Tax=Ructibacterium gallinarum TaxID=2779355 RepID=A0A9D5R8V5_9FIRM|nr:calcium-translocating P-type ATPase, PMCA-type [Ructibacterium gallinarum]MBE5040811.1 calcium-translocating P-type ATPase, PMCA-type [Ructibacterium gallinarum]